MYDGQCEERGKCNVDTLFAFRLRKTQFRMFTILSTVYLCFNRWKRIEFLFKSFYDVAFLWNFSCIPLRVKNDTDRKNVYFSKVYYIFNMQIIPLLNWAFSLFHRKLKTWIFRQFRGSLSSIEIPFQNVCWIINLYRVAGKNWRWNINICYLNDYYLDWWCFLLLTFNRYVLEI